MGRWCLKGGISLGLVVHGAVLVAELLTLVHGETSRSSTESVSLRTVLPSVACLAVDLPLVLCQDGGVEFLVAKTTLETLLVELATSGKDLLSGVDVLAALGALEGLWRLERHLC